MPWVRLHLDDYLEQGLDSLGIEEARRYETGVTDPDCLSNTEKLSDYADDVGDHDEDIVSEGTNAAPSKTMN